MSKPTSNVKANVFYIRVYAEERLIELTRNGQLAWLNEAIDHVGEQCFVVQWLA